MHGNLIIDWYNDINKKNILENKNQSIEKKLSDGLTIVKDNNSYKIKNKDGKVLSKLNYYEYKIKDFDWVLMANLDTKPEFRGQGLATKILNSLYDDISHNTNKGIYLFVKVDNENAINLYKKLGYKTVKTYTLDDGDYLIMAKGKADIKQLTRMNFS